MTATAFAGAFAAGLLSAFNACMLSMSPAVAAYFAGRKSGARAKTAAAAMALTLGLGSGLAIVGGIAGAAGDSFRISGPVWDRILGVVFLILGLGLTGVRLPVASPVRVIFFYARAESRRQDDGIVSGAFLLGLSLAFSPSPYSSPLLMAVLASAASSGAVLTGVVYAFLYGLGHGLPLALVALAAGRLHHNLSHLPWFRFAIKTAGLLMGVWGLYLLLRGDGDHRQHRH